MTKQHSPKSKYEYERNKQPKQKTHKNNIASLLYLNNMPTRKRSEDSRRKQGLARRSKKRPPFSEQWKENIRIAQRKRTAGGFVPWNKGKTGVYSKGIIEEMCRNRKGKNSGDKHWMFGRKHTEESKRKMSKSLMGRIAWNKGKKFPELSGEKHPNWQGGITPISRRLRIERLKKNGGSHTQEEWRFLKEKYEFMCLCCKQQEPSIKLTKDHIRPVSMGGSDFISNIQPLCQNCNSLKWAKLVDFRYSNLPVFSSSQC